MLSSSAASGLASKFSAYVSGFVFVSVAVVAIEYSFRWLASVVLIFGNGLIDGKPPVKNTNLLLQPGGPQQIATSAVGLDNSQAGIAIFDIATQVAEHPRAGHVDKRRIREITNDESKIGGGLKPLVDDAANVIDVEVEQSRLNAKDHQAGKRFVVRMALQIGVAPRATDAAQKSDMRTCGPGDEH